MAENFKCTIPYTPAKIDALDGLMKQARLSMGAEMVKADSGGVKSAFNALNRGEVIIMASDQVPNKKEWHYFKLFWHSSTYCVSNFKHCH